MGVAKKMGYMFSHHGEHEVHGDFLKVFSVFSVHSVVKLLGKPIQLSTLWKTVASKYGKRMVRR
jgi:hypothetical protein